jgi:transposase-like protein
MVREQRESGKTVRGWCAANNIKESTFYYWLQEIRKVALQAHEAGNVETEQGLVRIELTGEGNLAPGVEAVSGIRLQYKGAMLEIPPGTRAEDVSIVLKALGSA